MRTIAIAIGLVLFLLPVSIPLFAIVGVLQLIDPLKRRKFCSGVLRVLCDMAVFVGGTKIRVIGEENLPDPDETVLYVSNHFSYFDVPVAFHSIRHRRFGFIAKKEIERIPIFSWWMKLIDCLFIDRDDVKQGLKVILAATEKIQNGISVWVCPEGTRSKEEAPLPFKEGSFKMAKKTGCRIVPVAITGTRAIYEDHKPWVRKANVVLEIGEPFSAAELARENQRSLSTYAYGIISGMVEKNKQYL